MSRFSFHVPRHDGLPLWKVGAPRYTWTNENSYRLKMIKRYLKECFAWGFICVKWLKVVQMLHASYTKSHGAWCTAMGMLGIGSKRYLQLSKNAYSFNADVYL